MPAHPAEDRVRKFWDASGTEFNGGAVSRATRHGGRQQFLVEAVIEELVRCGLNRASIHTNEPLTLPGSYQNASKLWDVLVIEAGLPVAAFDFNTSTGGGAGKNLRNRMDEILAVGANVARAYDQPTVRALKPALGWVFLLEERPETTTPQLRRQSALAMQDPTETSKSFEGQLQDFFQRLLRDGIYNVIWYAVSQPPPDLTIREPDPEMGFTAFAKTMVNRIAEVRDARQHGNIDAAELGRMLAQRDDVVDVVSGLSSTEVGRIAVDLDVIRRRRELVAGLRELVRNPSTTEAEIQTMIGRKYWIFGGQYVGVHERRDAVPLDQHDIPLVCADRSIHVVELKRPGHKLVKSHRNHLIVSNEVHEAVGQCMNYLRAFDELGAGLETYHRNELGLDYDYRRTRGTVVIGNPELVKIDGVTQEQVEQTIRSYNAHLSRVQVLTFADLVDSAERALQFEEEEQIDG